MLKSFSFKRDSSIAEEYHRKYQKFILPWSLLKKMSPTSVCVASGFLLIQNPVCDCTGAWKNTQQRCGANRQEPKGYVKVWHLLGRMEIHKPNPECILKPAAADGCDMTERRSGGRVSHEAREALFSSAQLFC